jgi:hypothetical protein
MNLPISFLWYTKIDVTNLQFETAVKKYALKKILLIPGEIAAGEPSWRTIPDCQVILNSNENMTSIRDSNVYYHTPFG